MHESSLSHSVRAFTLSAQAGLRVRRFKGSPQTGLQSFALDPLGTGEWGLVA